MKPLLTLICLLIFAYLQVGYFFHTITLRQEAKNEIKERTLASLPDSSFIIFEWNVIEKKVLWEEEGKEFRLNDQMYDVVSQKKINGKVFLYCLNDTKEEQVVEQQMKMTHNAQGASNKSAKSSYSFPDIVASTQTSTSLEIYNFKLQHFQIASPNITVLYPEPPFCPPRYL